MSNSNRAKSGGVSTITIIGIVFVILKFCKVIDWPWIWVLCPFWGPLALLIVILGVVVLISILCEGE